MGFDTKYRPKTYNDVLGQEGTIKVLRRFVGRGQGFRQSYVFAGAWGSGKTTLARILARALLCEHPVEGAPCDTCPTCLAMLNNGCDAFREVDAATNSGKEDVKQILEEIMYSPLIGDRRIYLFDEAHQLSRQAMDALLLPMEDNLPGSEDKKLVCIFCTTEPDKMRPAILSRCAPVFKIQVNSPSILTDRLTFVADQEQIPYDREALTIIAEMTECHIRDALKALEGVSMLGEVSLENVKSYLQVDAYDTYLAILEGLFDNLDDTLERVESLAMKVSPGVAYQRIAETAMLAYRVGLLGDKTTVPSYLSRDRLKALVSNGSERMLMVSHHLSKKPSRATMEMLMCDLAVLSQGIPVVGQVSVALGSSSGVNSSIEGIAKTEPYDGKVKPEPGVTASGVYVDPKARNLQVKPSSPVEPLPETEVFRQALRKVVQELKDGSSGSTNLGGA